MIATLGTVAAPGAEQESDSPRPSAVQLMRAWVTDTQSGAKHSAAIGKAAVDCSRSCVHGSAQFALVDGGTIYELAGDLTVLKRTLNDSRLSVTSVAAAT